MNANDMHVVQLVRAYLPMGAELVMVQNPTPHAGVIASDLDRDGVKEISAIYRLNRELHLLILKYLGYGWASVCDVRGPGSQVTDLTAAPIIDRDRNNLIVGWSTGSNRSTLSVYEWTAEGLKDVAVENMNYTFLEMMDMPSYRGHDGTVEIALWNHDTEAAYNVEVLRWNGSAFVPASDVYPYYFQKVIRYYEDLTQKHPDHALYRYYLADAQKKAGMLQQDIDSELGQVRISREASLFPASVKTTDGTKWGFIDNKGSMVIPPQYDYAFDFQDNGLAIVVAHGRNGLINTSGQYVVKPVYDSISPFSEGRAAVIDSQGFKLIDESGNIVTKKAYSYISSFRNGRASFSIASDAGSSRYGYLDLQGNEVIPAQYEYANDFEHGKAVVKVKNNEFALIGPDGKRLATYPYANVGQLGDGYLPFQQQENGKYGYIDEKGKVMLSPAYTYAMAFQDERAVVNTAEDYKSRYGIINKQGKSVVTPSYNEIRQLGEQRFALGKAIDADKPYYGSIFAIADLNGRIMSEFRYYDVSEFKKGLASVSDRSHTYFIDRSGQAAPGYPRVDGSGTVSLQDSLIQARVDQRLSYLTPAGKTVWKQNPVIPLRLPYTVREEKYKPNKDYLVYYPQLHGMSDQGAQQKVNEKLKQMSQVKPVPASTQLDYSYSGDFDVTYFHKDLLVVEMDGYHFPFGAAHGMPSKLYAHVNVLSGQLYELKDLFRPGSNYVTVLSEIVGKQIKEDPQYSYVFPDTYKAIKPDQPFYVTENALHLYFYPYEIAPYAAGFPTFTIPFKEIMNIIAVNGAFWNSFHP